MTLKTNALAVVLALVACKPGEKIPSVKQNNVHQSPAANAAPVIPSETCTIKNTEAAHTELLAENSDTAIGEVENDTTLNVTENKNGFWHFVKVGFIKANETSASSESVDPKTKRERRKVASLKAYKPAAWRAGASEKVVFGQLENETVVTVAADAGNGWLKIEVAGKVDEKHCIK